MVLGAGMATVGFYAVPLALTGRIVNGTAEVNHTRRIQFASCSYIGPVIMGIGALSVLHHVAFGLPGFQAVRFKLIMIRLG